MSEIDLLAELGEPKSTENTESADSTTDTETKNTESADVSTEPKPKYPNIVEERPEDADVSDLMTVGEFASALSFRNFKNGLGIESIVKDQNIYAMLSAARHPLPVVLVGDKALLRWELAEEVYDNRPERGAGAATATTISDDRLLELSAKVRDRVNKLEDLQKVRAERIAEAKKTLDKRVKQGASRFGTEEQFWAKVDEWASAHEASSEVPDEADEAEKNGDTE